MSEITSRNGLAKALGVSLPTIDAWVRRGCPVRKRGGPGKPAEFDVEAVTGWVERYISRGSAIVSKGRTFTTTSSHKAEIIKALGHVTARTTGAAGLDLRTAHALEVLMNLEIDRATGAYLKEHGLEHVDLSDMFSLKENEVDWSAVIAERGEAYEEADWCDFVEDVRLRFQTLRAQRRLTPLTLGFAEVTAPEETA
jgi:hypothetical protein